MTLDPRADLVWADLVWADRVWAGSASRWVDLARGLHAIQLRQLKHDEHDEMDLRDGNEVELVDVDGARRDPAPADRADRRCS